MYVLHRWPGEVIVGGSSSYADTVYAIEMLCTDDSVRPRAWVRVRSVADDQPGEHGMAHAAHQLAGRIHVRSHPAEGTDPGPATEAIRSRLLSATRERIELDIESTRVPAVLIRDPESDHWLIHADRGDHEVVLTGEHADPMAAQLTTVPSVGPFLQPPLRRWVPDSPSA